MYVHCALQDLEKKEAEHKKSENIAHTEYNTLCKQLGITGYGTVRRELTEKVKELPEIYQRIAERTKDLDKLVEFYYAFVDFTFGQQYNGYIMPTIKHVIGTQRSEKRMKNVSSRYRSEGRSIYTYEIVKCDFCRERKHHDVRVRLRRGTGVDNRAIVYRHG